ncbi:MAG: dipeptidyl peptidase 3 [Dysgonamonadaceae bacterium]|jgi:dipeptidyl-peptidase-3|nr:dipeptidyl peptidase 3 [Dysgonamonadaceae bacterium]
MKKILMLMTATVLLSCSGEKKGKEDNFNFRVEQFADLQILRYQVPGFEELSLKQKELIYYLSQAALEGRDILFDQNFKYNLAIRRTLEAIYENYQGDKSTEDYNQLVIYLKRVWFSNGIHHSNSEEKFLPGCSPAFFAEAVKSIDASLLPLEEGETVEAFIEKLTPVMFDPSLYAIKVNQDPNVDAIKNSANNYYGENITAAEVKKFYGDMLDPNDATPVSYGLNSRLIKEDGKLVEKVWKIGGLYSPAIERIVNWLKLAENVAENDKQKQVIQTLIEYYQTGDLKKFDAYNIVWVQDTLSRTDFVNGFVETYGDPLGFKASWEAISNFKDLEATKRTEIISSNAQWFEDHSPTDSRFKKDKVTGVSAKVITVAILGGDCYPTTPIGINLPNSNWIRKDYGSKSVTMQNITHAYFKAAEGNGFNEEFVWSDTERELIKKYGAMTSDLNIDLHECLGHGSGQLLPGVSPDALEIYGAAIEETRADLFALYFTADPKTVQLGLLNNDDAYKAEYYRFMMNGLMTQLVRIEPGKTIQQTHMRNRALIAHWILEKGAKDNVVELVKRDGKTFVVINDYEKMRTLIGELLAEIQRIKSEGDFKAAQHLVETYAVQVDPVLHREILDRYEKLNLTPHRGFVNPVYEAVKDKKGNITNIKISYTEGYTEQMLRYSKDYSSLPSYNFKP